MSDFFDKTQEEKYFPFIEKRENSVWVQDEIDSLKQKIEILKQFALPLNGEKEELKKLEKILEKLKPSK